MSNARCRMHGGSSTGPKTAAGLASISRSRRVHGLYSKEVLMLRARVAEMLLLARVLGEKV